MTDVATLKVRVDSLEAKLAGRDLDALAVKGARAEKSVGGLGTAFARFAGPAAIAAAATAGFFRTISAQREFDILNAGLVTATGSTQGAAQAFQALQQFATETPYSLQQVSEAFVKLQNYGLDPSERALTSYGNTSAALGKDLMQMVEAVADAATGEFERLKEFGIRSKKQGDQISFTFRGVTETVANNATAIEEYLIRLGENNFAGNMANRMATLDGAMSNLGDEWDKLWLNLAQSGSGELVADGVRAIISVLEDLNAYLASGQFEAHMAALGESFGPWIDDAKQATDFVMTTIDDFGSWLAQKYPQDMQILTDAWQDFPENIRAIIQIAVTHVAWFVEKVRIAAGQVGDYWRAIEDGWGGKTLEEATKAATEAQQRNNGVLADSVDYILKQRDATDAAADAEANRAKMLRNTYEFGRRVAALQEGDQLAGFRRERPDSPTGPTKAAQKAAEAAEKASERARQAREREFNSLSASLRTEEEKIAESYANRRRIIEENTEAGSEARSRLMGRLDAELKEDESRLAESYHRRAEQARQGLMTEERELDEHFRRRREAVLENINDPTEQAALLAKLQLQKDTERAFLEAQRLEDDARILQTHEADMEAMRARHVAELAELDTFYAGKLDQEERYLELRNAMLRNQNEEAMNAERALWKARFSAGEEMFGALADLAETYGDKQDKTYRALFAMTKAFTIAKAAVDMQAAISDAMAKGWPQNIPLIAQAIAQGARILTTIRGLTYSGAYDSGGWIPAGSVGTVAERGSEIVNGQLVAGPAKVVSRKETQELLSGGGGGDVYVSINVNMAEGGVTTDTKTSGGSEAESAKQLGQLIELKVRDVLIREQRPGGLIYKPRVA